MSDELQYPSRHKQADRHWPKALNKKSRNTQDQRDYDHGNAEGMADPIHRMCMAAGVLRDPLFVCASTQHGWSFLIRGIYQPSLRHLSGD
jgi:hypothetical protein